MQIPKVVMSQELLREYQQKYGSSKHHATRPYCRICSTSYDQVFNQLHRGPKPEFGKERDKLAVHYVYLGLDGQAYKATFKNGQIAYYHISCLDAKPELKTRIEAQLRQETSPIAVSP